MDSAQPVGLLLVAISAALLAAQWHSGDSSAKPTTEHLADFRKRQLRRRTLASSLIGLVGLALILAENVPATPWSISFYLAGLLSGACLVLSLGIADAFATSRQRNRQTIDKLAKEFRRARHRFPKDNEPS